MMKTLAAAIPLVLPNSSAISCLCCFLLLFLATIILGLGGSTTTVPSVVGFSFPAVVVHRHSYGRDLTPSLSSSTATSLQLHHQWQLNDSEKDEDTVVDADYDGLSSRRRRFILNQIGRSSVLMTTVAAVGGVAFFNPRPASAADNNDEAGAALDLPTKETVVETFAPIKFELNDPNGGVATMQGRIDAEDWDGLMSFTQTYDLELRKKLMGKAKKLFQSKDVKSTATTYANGVTFDLIGINRASRKGQQSVESANKYLQELREDVTKFLSLESTIETL